MHFELELELLSTIPGSTEAHAAGRSGRACAARMWSDEIEGPGKRGWCKARRLGESA